MATKEKEKYTYTPYEYNQATKDTDAKRIELYSQEPGDFQYDDFKLSDNVTNLGNRFQRHETNQPGDYVSKWQSTLDDILNGYMNRDKFSYDLNGDALYQQYKDQYVTQGKQAMMDTMGQASAMTGGYGNSYAQTVGQQTYQGYLQQLNDRVPELYKLALDKYNAEGEEMLNKYGLVSDRENTDYGRYRDTVTDWRAESERLYNMLNNERNWENALYEQAYNKAWNEHRADVSDWQFGVNRLDNEFWNQNNLGYQQHSDKTNLEYTDYRNSIADEQWQKNYDETVRANKASEAHQAASLAESKRQYDESAKAKVVDDTPKYTYVSNKSTNAFKAGVQTRNEYYSRRKDKNKTYEEYIDETLQKWYEGNGPIELTEDEVCSLMADYGILIK